MKNAAFCTCENQRQLTVIDPDNPCGECIPVLDAWAARMANLEGRLDDVRRELAKLNAEIQHVARETT